jgi:proteasome lid subunit RPN8/RPN11
MVEHCVDGLPNEACGMLALDRDRIVKVYPTHNADASPVSYTVPPQEHFDALSDAEANGWWLGGVFHSHPNGPARMSETDLARVSDRKWVYLVITLTGKEPELTAWRDGGDLEIVP